MNRLGVGMVMAVVSGACSGACGGAPEPRSRAPRLVSGAASGVEEPAPLADECEQQPGTPPPEPLERSYAGVAARARCQGELRTIVSGVSHSLGAVRVLPLGSRLSRDDAPKTDRQLDFAIE